MVVWWCGVVVWWCGVAVLWCGVVRYSVVCACELEGAWNWVPEPYVALVAHGQMAVPRPVFKAFWSPKRVKKLTSRKPMPGVQGV